MLKPKEEFIEEQIPKNIEEQRLKNKIEELSLEIYEFYNEKINEEKQLKNKIEKLDKQKIDLSNQLKDSLNDLESQSELLNKKLIEVEGRNELLNNEIKRFKKELITIANTKPYKLAYFIRRFKFEFLSGNNVDKKNFIRWLSYKLLKKQVKPVKKFNPLLNLVSSSKSYPKKTENLELHNNKFLRFKNTRDKFYRFSLSNITCPFEKDLVSIILPIYNGEKMLKESIESILSQTYENFELIIINDGSTDRTKELIEFYGTKDTRIKIYHQENRGLPKSLSRGFRKARGEFYTWTSDDNIMDPDFIEKLVHELKKNKNLGMVYANIRLIDGNGEPILNHTWYPEPPGSDNVILPKSTLELNIRAANTIGPAFMYRASVAYILEDYSKYQFGIEDYDYWMRVNSLVSIKHSDFSSPVYSYRFHDNSLTSKAKELGILNMRDCLMIWDNFRRDYYLHPTIWVLESDENILKDLLKNKILSEGHIVFGKNEIEHLNIPFSVPSIYVNIVSDENNIKNAYNAAENLFKVVMVPYLTENIKKDSFKLNYDSYIALGIGDGELPKLDKFKGWFSIKDINAIFGFLDSKAKNRKLYELERIKYDFKPKKKVSVIIQACPGNGKLLKTIETLINQSFSKKDYEIIIVTDENKINYPLKKDEEIPEGFIWEIFSPQKDLFSTRNVGMWAAKGEILLFVDDTQIIDHELIKETWNAFKKYPEAEIIEKNVFLKIPKNYHESITDGKNKQWNPDIIPFYSYINSNNSYKLACGIYSVRKKALLPIGGFKTLSKDDLINKETFPFPTNYI